MLNGFDDLTESFQKAYRVMPVPVLILDQECKIIEANGAFLEALGIGQEMNGEKLDALSKYLGNSFQVLNVFKGIVESGLESTKAEIEMDCEQAGKFFFLMIAKRFGFTDQEQDKYLFVFHDHTAAKKSEKRMRLTAEKFRSVLLLANDAVLIVKSDAHIEFVNQKAQAFFGYSSKELIGMPYRMLFKNQVDDDFKIGIRKNGSEFDINASSSLVRVNGDTYKTIIIRDVTELKRLESVQNRLILSEKEAREVAEKSNQSKDLFLATLSHELRTPLTSILSWAQLIQKMKLNPEKIIHAATAIEQNALIQGQLIEDLLDLARIQSGKVALHLSEVEPLKVVRAAIESVNFLSQKKRIKINLIANDVVPQVFVDSSRLQQIVWNLLTNAIKFSPTDSEILVELRKIEDQVEIQVMDQGKGISSDFLPHIFKRFSQEDNTSIRAHGGLGLGLSLVYDLVKMQHGWIRAESEGPGKGAQFTVNFSALKESAKILDSSGPHEQVFPIHSKDEWVEKDLSLQGIRILLVDDEPDLLESISASLRAYGADVVTASSVAGALNELSNHLPDLLISDIAMPKEDGYSLIRQLRGRSIAEGSLIPAIAFTAYASKEDELKAKEAGFQIHISKPVKTHHLARVVLQLHQKQKLMLNQNLPPAPGFA
jgi:signal transduction histidine kinase/CheY-like chemotaxis protein